MSYKTCLIADLFCGPGKNGKENGSPIILLEKLKYILTAPQLKQNRNLQIFILFNDQNSDNIENLKKELKSTKYDENLIHITIENSKYEDLLPRLLRKPEKLKIPKFFFLDPFTYTNVKMEDLHYLMNLYRTEVLLFSPLFHTYRFTSASYKSDHKTRKFIEQFTTRGMSDYRNAQDYMTSIKDKLVEEIKVSNKQNPYVRPVLLDDGGSKNALFLITNHQKGMLLMNKILLKNTEDGSTIYIKGINQSRIFPVEVASNYYENYKNKFLNLLKQNIEVSNKQICDFTIREGFTPKQAKKIIKELYDLKRLNIFSEKGDAISNSMKWKIADNISDVTILKWISNEKK